MTTLNEIKEQINTYKNPRLFHPLIQNHPISCQHLYGISCPLTTMQEIRHKTTRLMNKSCEISDRQGSSAHRLTKCLRYFLRLAVAFCYFIYVLKK